MSRVFVTVVSIVFVAGAFAGCLGGTEEPEPTKPSRVARHGVSPDVYESNLSKDIYAETIRENVKVPSFDGKLMDNWVYRPKTPDGVKVPVFINLSPYWGITALNSPPAQQGGDAFSRYMIEYFVPRGYAVVLSAARGTGESEGCFNIGGETEMKDSVAVIEYFSKQPWSNGNVAAGGKSYDGTMANGVATKAPPALKAIFPVSGISELYKYNYKGGVAYSTGAVFNTYYYALVMNPESNARNPLLMADDIACADLANTQPQGVGSGATGDYTAYWTERNYTKDASKVTAAVFLVHGFTDWNVKPDNILPWIDAIPANVPKKVWLHNWTEGGDGHMYPKRDDWNLTMLRFLDQTLKGIETGIFDEPAFQVADSEGQWSWEEEWPPARAVPTKFYLGSRDGKGGLDPTAPFRSGVRVFTDNGQGPANGAATNGNNFIRYETAPLADDLRYAGTPIVQVHASSNQPTGKIIASLYDLDPEGNAREINYGGLNFRHRDALEDPQPVLPDATYYLRFEMFPQNDVVRAGHRLVLMLAGGGGDFLSEPTQETISVQEDENAFLTLPLIDSATVDFEDPQPLEIDCFAC